MTQQVFKYAQGRALHGYNFVLAADFKKATADKTGEHMVTGNTFVVTSVTRNPQHALVAINVTDMTATSDQTMSDAPGYVLGLPITVYGWAVRSRTRFSSRLQYYMIYGLSGVLYAKTEVNSHFDANMGVWVHNWTICDPSACDIDASAIISVLRKRKYEKQIVKA